MTRILLLLWPLWLALPAAAHDGHAHAPPAREAAASGQPLALSAAFDRDGRLWRAYVRDGQVLVDSSADRGKSFGAAVAVNAQPEKIGAAGELRPKLAFGPEHNIYVSWTQPLAQPYAGHIRFSRSTDGGRRFSAPVVVNHDRAEITHRFDALTVTPDGRVWLAWIDKRDLVAAKAAGRPYDGAAIYYAVSGDGGASFAVERKASDASCECCRIAMLPAPDNTVVAMWRQLYPGGVRDHAIARLDPAQPAEVHRASFGGWKIDACPHHGPALARGGDWGWHMAWYDGGDKAGLYYARMDGEAWVSSPARRFGDAERQAGHPALLARGEAVWLAWKELDAKGAEIRYAHSVDGGRSWTEARPLARADGATDYPALIADGERAYLSWNTAQGYRLIALPEAP